jgi:xanthine dehydrogenase accessory factor
MTDAAYVAMVSSEKKAAALRERLTDAGVPSEKLARLRAPAGLRLGGRSPAEIAIAILAEIVQFRAGRDQRGDANAK